MIIRNRFEVQPVEWGNGQSYRVLLDKDGMGFAVAHTVVTAGTESRLQYREHLEACYCIAGAGVVQTADGRTTHTIEPGTVYALNEHDAHVLIAAPDQDMHLVSVFNPPLTGQERHTLTPDGFSQYDKSGGDVLVTAPTDTPLLARLDELSEPLSVGHLLDDAAAEFPAQKWKLVAETGLFGLATEPGQHSDQQLGSTVAALEALGYACRDSGLSFSVASHLASCGISLARFGSGALQCRFLPAIRSGELIGAHAITEPETGSDALSMTTTATRDGDRFVLNGRKAYVTNGPIADLFVIYARTGPTGTAACLTAFLVERATPGLSVGPSVAKMGLRTSPLGELQLTDVSVPADQVVGPVGGGFLVLNHVMAREILAVSAIHVGEMRYRLELCRDRTRHRVQFGKPIGAFQAIAHRVVDMAIGMETAARWVHDTTARLDAAQDATAEVAMTKLVTSEVNVTSARHALQIFGGAGYLAETGVERTVRDAMAAPIYSGTSEMQKNRVAALLGVPTE